MSRQATDNLYIELDYFTPEEYYTYEAVAASAQSTEFSVACDASIVASGEIVIASGDFPAFATLTATISHIEGSDMFAFTEAAIAVAVDRIRDNNIAATAVFDIATDGRAFRDVAAAQTSLFDFDVVNGRSREFNLETQAAFSLTADNTRLKLYASELTTESTIFCAISHTKGVDIIQQNFASLDIVAEVTANGVAVLESVSTLAVTGGFKDSLSATLNAYSSLFVSRNISKNRPISLAGFHAMQTIDPKKYGTAAGRITPGQVVLRTLSYPIDIRLTDNDIFVTEFWIHGRFSLPSTLFAFLGGQGTGTSSTSTTVGNNQWVLRIQQTGTFSYVMRLLVKNSNNETMIFDSAVEPNLNGTRQIIPGNNVWNHYAVTRGNDKIFRVYKNGNQIISGLVPTIGTATEYRVGVRNDSLDTTSAYLDEFSYKKGVSGIYGLNNPIVDDANQVFLFHFEETATDIPLDDTSGTFNITQTGQGALTSVSSISATLSGPQRTAASLTATASVVSTVSVDRGADITVNNFATLAADVTHIKSLSSNLSSEFSQQATADYIFAINADLTVDSQTVVDSERTRSFEALTDAVGVIVAVTAKVGAFFINAETATIFAVDVNKTTDITTSLTVDSNTSILGEKYGSLEAELDTESTVNASANRTRNTEVSLNSAASINIESSNTLDIHADLTSEFMIMVDASGGTIRATLVADSFANLSVQARSTLSAQSSLSSLFTLSADTEDSLTVRIVSDMFSNGSVTANNSRLRDNIIATDSIATNLVAVVKTADADIALTSTLNLSASVNKIVGYTSELASSVSVSALGSLTRTGSAGLTSLTTVNANGRLLSEASADLTSSTTLSAISVKGTEILLQAFTNAGLTLDANVIREVTVEESATTELSADTNRIRFGVANLLAFTAQLTVGGRSANAVAIQLGTFTLSAQIGVLHLQEYVYIVPGETRYYKISSETRVKSIAGETRIYTIRR